VSIFENARSVRLATLLAIALALLVSGVVGGAAGAALIMGAANSAGTSNTSLTTTSTGTALLTTQNGTGTALRGVASNGIAGFFTSANGSGVSGVVAANTKYGVYGGNDAATFGGGAAIRASGQQNNGVVATTANAAADAVRAINTGGGQALDLVVNADVPPMSVNSNTKVVNLHADLFDGLDYDDILQGNVIRITHSVPATATVSSTTWFTTEFTQPAGFTLASLAAEAIATVPSTCPSGPGSGLVAVDIDNVQVMQGSRPWTVETANLSVPILVRDQGGHLVAPAAATTRTVTVRITSSCNSSPHWTFTNFTLDVVFAK
jgi:hypothetical protein